jgi:hypothetical protein
MLHHLHQFSTQFQAKIAVHYPHLRSSDTNRSSTAFRRFRQSGISLNHKRVRYFVSVDNLLNKSYSLGNDINAAGRRYYNPSSPRSYMAGISVQVGKFRR